MYGFKSSKENDFLVLAKEAMRSQNSVAEHRYHWEDMAADPSLIAGMQHEFTVADTKCIQSRLDCDARSAIWLSAVRRTRDASPESKPRDGGDVLDHLKEHMKNGQLELVEVVDVLRD
jgi:hypothetical protein